jgi:hypothetical protein
LTTIEEEPEALEEETKEFPVRSSLTESENVPSGNNQGKLTSQNSFHEISSADMGKSPIFFTENEEGQVVKRSVRLRNRTD